MATLYGGIIFIVYLFQHVLLITLAYGGIAYLFQQILYDGNFSVLWWNNFYFYFLQHAHLPMAEIYKIWLNFYCLSPSAFIITFDYGGNLSALW